jgi:ABC-type transport system involved in multi-copper enzyme maturation permease subunit
MRGGRIGPFAAKEFRALVPVWIASAVAITAAVLSGPLNHKLGLIAYGFGSVTLGAQSIGHEYTGRTLTLLLSQPWSRRRLLLLKLAVLTVMLLTLAAFAWLTLLKPGDQAWVFLSLLNGLCLAPLLTMVARTAMAGVVFSGAAPLWLLVISRFVSAGVLWGSMLTLSAAAAVAGWRMFMRLEAIDGRDQDVRLPRLLRGWTDAIDAPPADAAGARHPVWLLVKKELHLQQMTFAVAGVSGLFWVAEFAFTKIVPGYKGLPRDVPTVVSGALLALLIGSLASAEERQLGTLEWQVLMPMPMWQQWAVKVGTALGLAALFSFALPVVLAAGHVSINAMYAGVIALLTTGSLYVSSLCRTTLRALIVSGALVVGLSFLASVAAAVVPPAWSVPPLAALVALVLWSALALWFGLENHRSGEHSARGVCWQLLWMAGGTGLGAAAFAVVL